MLQIILIYTRRLQTYLTQGIFLMILQGKEQAEMEENPGTEMFVLQLI